MSEQKQMNFNASNFLLLSLFLINFCAITVMYGNASSLGPLELLEENLTVALMFIAINAVIFVWINMVDYFKNRNNVEEEE